MSKRPSWRGANVDNRPENLTIGRRAFWCRAEGHRAIPRRGSFSIRPPTTLPGCTAARGPGLILCLIRRGSQGREPDTTGQRGLGSPHPLATAAQGTAVRRAGPAPRRPRHHNGSMITKSPRVPPNPVPPAPSRPPRSCRSSTRAQLTAPIHRRRSRRPRVCQRYPTSSGSRRLPTCQQRRDGIRFAISPLRPGCRPIG